MANLVASLKLLFKADTGALKAAIGTLRDVRKAANGVFSGGTDPNGKPTKSPFGQFASNTFSAGNGSFKLAADLNQAASAMQAFKGQIDSVTREPIQLFADFEKQMAVVKGKTDGITKKEFKALNDSAREIGRSSRFGAQEAAEGYGELAAAGLSAQQQLGALPPLLKLTTAGGLGLAQTTNIALSTMNQFGLKVTDLTQIGDLLTQGFNASSIELGDLAESLGYVGPIAKAAGLNLRTTVGFVALLGNAGIVGSRSGTALNATLARMANVTPRAAKALSQLGISKKEIGEGLKDPVAFFAKMNAAMDKKGFDKAQRLSALVRVFGQEAAPAVAEMMAKASEIDPKTGKTGFASMIEQMSHAEGATDRFAAAVSDTTEDKLKRFDAQMADIKITLGQSLAPALLDLNKGLAPTIKEFANWIKHNPKLVGQLGRLALTTGTVLAVMTPLVLAASSAATAFGVFRIATALGVAPLKGFGNVAGGLATKLRATNTAAGMAGSAMLSFAAVTGAAFAGWEVGQILDDVIGKMMGLRGGKLSTEAALSMGESPGMNDLVAGVGELTGIQAIKDVAAGNSKANQDRTNAKAEAAAAVDRKLPPPAHVEVKVNVTDERTTVKSKTKRATAKDRLPVGSNI